MRSPYQILVFPFIKQKGKHYFALFKREDMDVWQGIAGGGEGEEKPMEAAKREAFEEGAIPMKADFVQLATITTIPVEYICGFKWGDDIAIIPEYSFGVEIKSKDLKLSMEHTQYEWFDFKDAMDRLKWDSNKTALWELNHCLCNGGFNGIKKNIEVRNQFL